MIGETRCHRGRARPPLLGPACTVGWKWLAQPPMGQAKVVVAVVQGQLLVQALFALAQGGDTSADRRHMLTDGEVEAFHACCVALPATGCQHLLYGLKRPEDHTVTDAH